VGSDLLYTACVLGLTATLALRHRQDLYLVLGILTAGHLIGLPLLRLLPRARTSPHAGFAGRIPADLARARPGR
jgi:hypothetical protein